MSLTQSEPDTFLNSSPPGGSRPSWSGWLQLSLVGIPLKAYPAVRTSQTSPFHQFHADCGQRIRYAKHCPVHGAVAGPAIVRGYEYGPGRQVVVAPEDLDPLRPAQDRALRLERFLKPAQFDPLLFSGRGLHLVADGPAARCAYGVLRTAMSRRDRWAVGRMVLNGQRQLVLVRPAGTLLVLHVLHYPERIRGGAVPPAKQPAGPDSEELRLAGQLIDAASGRVDWTSYRDETAQELRKLIDAKLQGCQAHEEPVPVVVPLVHALQQCVAQTLGAADGAPAKAAAPHKRGRRLA